MPEGFRGRKALKRRGKNTLAVRASPDKNPLFGSRAQIEIRVHIKPWDRRYKGQ